MTDQTEVQPHVEFAAKVAELVDDNTTFQVVLNGLAVASAAFLVDYVTPRDGSPVDEFSLFAATTKFKELLDNAAKFAAEQLNASRQAEPEPSRIVLS